ncbi:hypothetical protein [Sphingomonas turrisvirgatae]|nr:hypothetical protein [Sphingomonas turrisvirgatae]
MASTATDTASAAPSGTSSNGLLNQAKGQASKLTDMGLAKAAEFADGKKQAAAQQVNGIADIVREFGDAAGEQFGPAVGGAISRGGDAVAQFAAGLDERSLEDIVDTTRTTIVRHPGAALAIAAVAGFAGGRILKGAMERGAARQAGRTNDKQEKAA